MNHHELCVKERLIRRILVSEWLNFVAYSVRFGLRRDLKSFLRFSNLRLLIFAKSKDISIEKINELMNEGAKINTADHLNNSVLHHVIKNRNASLKIVKFLLETGAYPDARNYNNDPPIVFCRDLSIAQLLIKYTVIHRMLTNTLENHGLNGSLSEIESTSSSHEVREEFNLLIHHDIRERNYFAAFRDFCFAELKMMMKDKIAPNFTFFNFITQHCLKNLEASQIFEHFDESCITKILLRIYNNNYPYYQDLIYTALRHSNVKVTGRMFDLQIYMVVPVTDFTERTIFLNAECVSKIEDYLSNEDIVNLIVTFAQNSKLREMFTLKRHMEEGDENSSKKLKSIEN